jgi:dTDP-4-amino-4,6-dideoxygalactose transaminase
VSSPPAPERSHDVVQVLVPRLPPAERLVPYLRRIDETRIYSNWGPLVSELEGRLAQWLRLPEGCITSASSGTAALTGAILGHAGRATPERPVALVPALTFVATAVAVEHCGYRPHLVDVDSNSWMLDPERLVDHPVLDRVGLVVPVAPFGRPVPQASWQSFGERTGIPVVIDGAASFDRVSEAPDSWLGEVPVAISFHATKSFATGEGGCVASTDAELVRTTAQALNFGLHMTRESRSPSLNGKMSEYHAAVGLAELDGWPDKHLALRNVADGYRRWAAAAGLSGRVLATPEVGASYALLRCEDADQADRVQRAFRRSAVDHRLWYGRGLHHHPYFSGLPHDGLEVTDRLAPCLLGLPLAPDLTEATIRRIVEAVARGSQGLL